MKKLAAIIFSLAIHHLCLAQKREARITEDSIIRKWTLACINIEARPNFLVSKFHASLQKPENQHKINNVALKEMQDKYRRIAYRSTAIFLLYKNKHYLLTARHCLIDTGAALSNYVFERFFLGDNESPFLQKSMPGRETIPEVRYFDGHIGGKNPKYILSDEAQDIGIIALDDIPVMGRQFVAMLYDKGYRPILFADIDSKSPVIKDERIITVGFPRGVSELEKFRKNIDSSINHWQSPYVTVPVVSRGIVRDNYKGFFTGDIFSYYGNSGGPVISNNKLIGLNIAILRPIKTTNSQKLNHYIDGAAYFSKSSNVINQLQKLASRFPPTDKPYVVDTKYLEHLTGLISGGQVTVQVR